MYKNYKIDKNGTPRYDSYHISPERRNTEISEEWKKRLEGKGPKALRRRAPHKKEQTIKVETLVYLFIGIVIIAIINNSGNKTNLVLRNEHNINISLNSAVRDLGNENIKPNVNNLFLHVDLNVHNISRNVENININDFILRDEYGTDFKPVYLNMQNEISSKELGEEEVNTLRLTFEMPMYYKNQVDLVYSKEGAENRNITRFNLE